MERMVNANGYGICLFSANTLEDFLKNCTIKLAGQDEPFDDQWEKKIDYDGFNLEIEFRRLTL